MWEWVSAPSVWLGATKEEDVYLAEWKGHLLEEERAKNCVCLHRPVGVVLRASLIRRKLKTREQKEKKYRIEVTCLLVSYGIPESV